MVRTYQPRTKPNKKRVEKVEQKPDEFIISQETKHTLNKELIEKLTDIISPVYATKESLSFHAFDDKTELYESRTIDVHVSFFTGESSLSIGTSQLSKLKEIGYALVSFHADKGYGQVITFHKMPKGKKK